MKKKLFLFLILTILVSILFLVFFIDFKKETDHLVYDDLASNNFVGNDWAESMIVMDMRTKRVLNNYHEHKKMLPASITKILTCITCIEHYNLDEIVVVGDEVLDVEGSSIYLKVGDVITVRDLLYGLMLCSGNDAAKLLAYHLDHNVDDFVYLMNETAKKIGMTDSHFENPSGLNSVSRNTTTAYDMAILMSYAMENETFRTITKTKNYKATLISNKTMYFRNKHRLIQENDTVIGGKTGYTKEAKRTLVTCFKKDDFEIVVVTLNCGSDWEFHKSLAEKCYQEFELKQVVSKIDLFFSTLMIGKINVKKEDLLIPLKKDEKVDVKLYYNDEYVQLQYFDYDKKIASVWLKRGKNDE